MYTRVISISIVQIDTNVMQGGDFFLKVLEVSVAFPCWQIQSYTPCIILPYNFCIVSEIIYVYVPHTPTNPRILLHNQGPEHMPRMHRSLKAYCATLF